MSNSIKKDLGTGNQNIKDIQRVFELSKKLSEQKKEINDPLEDRIKNKIEELSTTGSMNSEIIPIVVGTSGMTIKSDNISKSEYLSRLNVDHSLYENIIFTEEEAKRISRKMTRLSAGVNSVVPMACTGESCVFKTTCLTGNTLVTLFDGTTKKISDLKRRDRLLSFNTKTKMVEFDQAFDNVKHMGNKPIYRIVTTHGHFVFCTVDHPIYVSEGKKKNFNWSSIEDGVSVGDMVVITDSFYNELVENDIEDMEQYGDCFLSEISSIDYIGKEDVFDIEVVKNKNFFANGMLVHNCPYYEEDKAPVGLPCLVEVNLLHFYTTQYLNEFDVDPSRITEMHLVGELAELDIYEMRSTKLIAEKYPTMISDVVMGFDSEGTPLINEDISKVFDLKERLKKSRMKILETLMATRKERVKSAIAAAGVGEVRTISSLYDKLESIKASMSSMKESRSGDIIDVEAEEV